MRDSESKGSSKILLIVVPIIVALISCLGVVTSALINKFPISTISAFASPLAATNTPLVLPSAQVQFSPTANLMPTSANQGITEHYILGYTEKDLVAKPVLETCKEPACRVIFIKSLDELPDDWYHLTGNVASATINLPDGCRTKQELINLQVIYMVANNYTPCSSQLSVQSNLLQNANFENALNSWMYSERHISGLYETSGYNGKGYCSRQNLTATDTKGWVGFVQEVPVEGGKTYYFSAWVKLNKVIQFHTRAEWYNGSNFMQLSLINSGIGVPPNGETTDGWAFIQGTTLAPVNATKALIGFWHGVINDQTNVVDSEFCADDVTFGLLR